MNKFIKVILIISLVMFSIGFLGSLALTATVGVSAVNNGINEYLRADDVSFRSFIEWGRNLNYSFKFSDNLASYNAVITEDFDRVQIDISAAESVIKVGDECRVTAKVSSLPQFKCEVVSGTLIIKYTPFEENFSSFSHYIENIEIILPDEVYQKLEIDVGAGAIEINDIRANSAYLDVGAGTFDINDADLNNAVISCGVGEVSFKGKLTGECEISNGVGSSSFKLENDIDDYYLDINNGLGSIEINGNSYVSFGSADTGYGNRSAPNKIIISNGIGEIEIDTK